MSVNVPARIRDLAQQRAGGRCEYCLIHEFVARTGHAHHWDVEPRKPAVRFSNTYEVNQLRTEAEVQAVRARIQRGRAFGGKDWTTQTATWLNAEPPILCS